MRLKPAEVRIINEIRGLKAGQVIINKGSSGQLDVRKHWKDAEQQAVQPAERDGATRRLGQLRG